MQQSLINQSLEMTRHASCECSVTNQQANLDVSVEGSLGEVGGRYKNRLVVRDNRFSMEYAQWTIGLDGPGIVIDLRP